MKVKSDGFEMSISHERLVDAETMQGCAFYLACLCHNLNADDCRYRIHGLHEIETGERMGNYVITIRRTDRPRLRWRPRQWWQRFKCALGIHGQFVTSPVFDESDGKLLRASITTKGKDVPQCVHCGKQKPC